MNSQPQSEPAGLREEIARIRGELTKLKTRVWCQHLCMALFVASPVAEFLTDIFDNSPVPPWIRHFAIVGLIYILLMAVFMFLTKKGWLKVI